MKIILYKNQAENIRLDKSDFLSEMITITGFLREQSSIINPVITIEGNDLTKYNYCYIEEFHRYYYIDDIVSVNTNLWRIYCRVDVLMSFRPSIQQLNVFANRNEFNYNEFIPDNMIPATCKMNYNFTLSSQQFLYPVSSTEDYGCIIVIGGEIDYSSPVPAPDFSTSMNKILITSFYGLQIFINSFIGISSQGSLFGSSIGDSIQGIYIAPFQFLHKELDVVPISGTESGDNVTYKIHFLNNEISVTGHKDYFKIYELKYSKYSCILKKSFIIEPDNILPNNFLAYRPYSVAQMFIPFYGFIDIEPEFINKGYRVEFIINVATNSCLVEIYSESKKLYYISDFPIFAELPISYSDINSKKRNIIASSVTIAAGIAGAAFTGGASLGITAVGAGQLVNTSTKSTTKYGKGASNYGEVIGSDTQTSYEYAPGKRQLNKLTNFVSSATIDLMSAFGAKNFGGKGNSLGSSWFINNLKVIVYYGTIDYRYPDKYNQLVGRPSDYVGKLSGLKGYTEIAGCHIENLDIAMSEEISEVDNILKTGIILPYPFTINVFNRTNSVMNLDVGGTDILPNGNTSVNVVKGDKVFIGFEYPILDESFIRSNYDIHYTYVNSYNRLLIQGGYCTITEQKDISVGIEDKPFTVNVKNNVVKSPRFHINTRGRIINIADLEYLSDEYITMYSIYSLQISISTALDIGIDFILDDGTDVSNYFYVNMVSIPLVRSIDISLINYVEELADKKVNIIVYSV